MITVKVDQQKGKVQVERNGEVVFKDNTWEHFLSVTLPAIMAEANVPYTIDDKWSSQ